ncbi:MAG: FAD-binding oxidoreductase [Actinobacteria bacterium]|nr:FAD-binding oxidoreductase [Actinomycetota bacterium]
MTEKKGKDPQLALARIRGIMVDPARFSTDEDAISAYLEPGEGATNLLAVAFPRGVEDIREVLEVARGYQLSVYTPVPWGLNPPRPGIVVDFEYMADIKDIDTKNLFLEVEPGVTWEQVIPELSARGVRIALPASAKSPYVLENALEREVVIPACRFTNKQLSTFHAVLADGREYRSGSDALPEARSHWREDGGPNVSRVFTGSRNSFGVPTGGFIFLYPEPEARKVVARGLANRKSACLLADRAARSEVGTEIVVMNRLKAKEVFGGDPGLPTWSAVFGLEGSTRLVSYQEKRIDVYAAELKLKPKKGTAKLNKAAASALSRPWYAPETSLGFYTNFGKVEKLSTMVESALKQKGKLAQMIIPIKRGASVYVQFDLQDGVKGARSAVSRLLPRLADAGAFFPNPTGALATHIFAKQPGYFRLLKDIKKFFDPDDILNSGQVVEV